MKLIVGLVKANNKLQISVVDKIINHITPETIEVAHIVERW